MTNETARREIESLDYYLQNHTDDYSEESHTAMMMAIKALEQEPCNTDTPKPKTGYWILTDDDFVYCSECEDSYYPRPIDASWLFCPHCGARMG